MLTKEHIFELLREPSAASYSELLRGVVEHTRFRIRSDDLCVLWQRFEAGDLVAVRGGLAALTELWIHSPEFHILAHAVAKRLGDQQTAMFEAHFARCCIQGIQATGDGSLARPYHVARVEDEYTLLRLMEKKWTKQNMLEREGHVVDVFECTDGEMLHFRLPRADLLTGEPY